MDITINILPLNKTIKAHIKSTVLGVKSHPDEGNLTIYLDPEGMSNVLENDLEELEGIHHEIGGNFLEFFPKEGEYEVKITF